MSPCKKIVIIALAVVSGIALLHLSLRCIPYPELQAYRNRPYGFAALDRNGRTLRVFPAADGVKREWVSLDGIPAAALRVFVRAEDRRFYLHGGVDLFAVAAAAARNLRAGRTVSGASTITMQLARLIRPHGAGLGGKLGEAFDALRLEARLSKKQILELWINGIPFGGNIEGLAAASRARFGREAARLDEARAALLAVIPRRPALYDPARNPQAAVDAALVLAARCGLRLDEAALRAAAADAAPEMFAAEKNPFYAPHFTERVKQLVIDAGGVARDPAGGLRGGGPDHKRNGCGATVWKQAPLLTTLDLDLQRYAEQRLAAEIARLEQNRVGNGAIVAVDNATGAVLAYAGSVSWFNEAVGGKIDGARVENQPGSCLKPFLYALAVEKGFGPNDVLPDIPTVFGGGEAYSPANFNRRFNGPVRLRVALASSLNVPAVYLLERLSVRAFEDYLAALDFDSIARTRGSYGAGLALGNAGVSLEELTRAFAVFPRGGRTLALRFIHAEGEGGAQAVSEGRQVMSPYTAWVIADMLSDRASRFIGFGPAPTLATAFPSMFKTGTANQFQHIWALGATARFTVGVWMGNFSGETVVGRTGSSIPARIAADLLRALEGTGSALPSTPASGGGAIFGGAISGEAPGNVRDVTVCALSGMAATSACGGTVREWLPAGRLPAPCSWHRGGEIEYPPEYRAWLRERFHRGQAASAGGAFIRLPAAGSVFYFDPALPPEAQAIRVEAAGFGGEALVYDNDVLQGGLNGAGVFALPLRRGLRRIVVEDESGASAAVEIEVR